MEDIFIAENDYHNKVEIVPNFKMKNKASYILDVKIIRDKKKKNKKSFWV